MGLNKLVRQSRTEGTPEGRQRVLPGNFAAALLFVPSVPGIIAVVDSDDCSSGGCATGVHSGKTRPVCKHATTLSSRGGAEHDPGKGRTYIPEELKERNQWLLWDASAEGVRMLPPAPSRGRGFATGGGGRGAELHMALLLGAVRERGRTRRRRLASARRSSDYCHQRAGWFK